MTDLVRKQLEKLRDAMSALPEPTSTVYRLHLVDGLDYKAIARQLGLPVAEIEQHVARAIILIDRELR